MTFKHHKTPEELERHLRSQIGHLRRSMVSYDDGHLDEAQRIASSLYTLFFDGRSNTKSVTGMVGVKKSLRFPDSAWRDRTDPKVILLGPPLCSVGVDGCYHPKKAGGEKKGLRYPLISFQKWWDQIVYQTDRNLSLSRKNLIFAMRNTDGGGHVDPVTKNEAYHWLSAYGDIAVQRHVDNPEYGNFTIYLGAAMKQSPEEGKAVLSANFEEGENKFSTNTGPDPLPSDAQPIKHAHWASIRQIAWEAEQAFVSLGY